MIVRSGVLDGHRCRQRLLSRAAPRALPSFNSVSPGYFAHLCSSSDPVTFANVVFKNNLFVHSFVAIGNA